MQKVIIMALLLNSTLALATGRPDVHNRLFNILNLIRTEQVQGTTPCTETERLCQVEVEDLICLRFGGCRMTMFDDGRIPVKVKVPKTNRYYLFLYMAMRSGSVSTDIGIERFGPRYRPNFKVKGLLTCMRIKDPDQNPQVQHECK